jgi:hypothetical protein
MPVETPQDLLAFYNTYVDDYSSLYKPQKMMVSQNTFNTLLHGASQAEQEYMMDNIVVYGKILSEEESDAALWDQI